MTRQIHAVRSGETPAGPDAGLDAARRALVAARRVLVLSGAGISAESGLRTFRGADGWWRERRAEELATPAAFAADPRLVWEWYDERRQALAAAAPNDAHRTLARWEGAGREVLVVTQNVDDLHERAGSHDVVHIHGRLWEVRCVDEGRTYEDRTVPFAELPPRCRCGALLRPNVVWFGEMLPASECARVEDFLREGGTDLVLVVGTQATFGYIRAWALQAHAEGAMLVEVNARETELTGMLRGLPHALHLSGRAGQVLAALEEV